MFIVHLVPQNWQGGTFYFYFLFRWIGFIFMARYSWQMTRVTMVTAVFAIVSLNKHTNISFKRALFVFPRWGRLVDLGGSAIAHARSVFLARNSKIKNTFFFPAALILGVGGDDKHKYFFICPYGVYHKWLYL
jgi:hypothetical protein